MTRRTIFTAVLMLFAVSAWAQMGDKPGAEVKKLDYFVGTWTTEGTVSPGPWGAGGKFSGTHTNEWMSGDFFLVGHGTFKMPSEVGGEGTETSIQGYDTDKNVYTRDGFNSGGRHDVTTSRKARSVPIPGHGPAAQTTAGRT